MNNWDLFKFSYKKVPAYRRFLNDHKIGDSEVSKIKWENIPLTSKDNYLRRYQYSDLFPNRAIALSGTISATSGSTGKPFYFPRFQNHDRRHDNIFESFLKDQFDITKKKTLAIVGFGMGIWIGGILTYRVFNQLSSKYQIMVTPVGVNKELILETIKKMGGYFDQIILCGYPYLIKDLADTAEQHGVNLRQYHIRIITAAEGYSEKFRDYLGKKIGLRDVVNDTINIYGSVELGTMAHETVLTNTIRRAATKKRSLFRDLFPEANILPTLGQYDPELIWFEQVNKEVIATGHASSIPLIRYRLSDLGDVITFKDMLSILKAHNINIDSIKIKKLPFVYIYGRSDDAVILHGANIYPAEIKAALENKIVSKWLTGKFTLVKKENRNLSSHLEVNLELKSLINPNPKIIRLATQCIVNHLRENNSEFNNEYSHTPKEVTPRVVLWPYQSPNYFGSNGKQKWVKNNAY